VIIVTTQPQLEEDQRRLDVREGEAMIRITIPGRPVPKGRPRLGIRGRKAYVYTPPETRKYEKIVGWVAKSQGCQPIEGPVSVSMHVFCRGKMDVDNVAKSVLDGLNGVAYEDDDQVVELLVKKHKVKRKEDERVEIEVRKKARIEDSMEERGRKRIERNQPRGSEAGA